MNGRSGSLTRDKGLRRPNHASRAAATSVVGQRSMGSTARLPVSDGYATARPPVPDGSMASTARLPVVPLDQLERDVQELKRALEEERKEVADMQATLKEIFNANNCEDYLRKIERRIQVMENKDVETIHWTIPDAESVRLSYRRGQHLASPTFSACGVDGFKFHLYPRGDDFCEEGYCSLYFHVPDETRIVRTLFVGKRRNGPEEADSVLHCGVSEMCVFGNEIDRKTNCVVVGVEGLRVLSSPNIVETRTKLVLTADA